MATKIDRIANLLASGLKPSMVAPITGVSPSYISQLLADPDFKAHVESLAAELMDQESANDDEQETTLLKDKLLGAEHKIIDNILSRIDMMSDGHVIAALSKIGDRRDALTKQSLINSGVKALRQNGGTLRMVELNIPAIAAPELTIGKNNEIIMIGNRAINPMPTAALQKLVSAEVIENDPFDEL